ncbi:MAG: DUF4160 domain-containing protein [Bryobacteraceae bacterium]
MPTHVQLGASTRHHASAYRLFFTSFDCTEPPHIHVEREHRICKIWL